MLEEGILGPFGAYLEVTIGHRGSAALLAGALAARVVGPLGIARGLLARREVV